MAQIRSKTRGSLIYAVLAGFLVLAFGNSSRGDEAGVPIAPLLEKVRDTLIEVDKETDGKLRFISARLTLKTVAEIESGGKVNFLVVKAGAKVSETQVHTLVVALEPPRGDSVPASAEVNALAQAISAAYRAADDATRRNPPLRLKTITATTRFVLKTEGSGGVAFTLAPVTIEAGAGLSNENVQELTLEFGG